MRKRGDGEINEEWNEMSYHHSLNRELIKSTRRSNGWDPSSLEDEIASLAKRDEWTNEWELV